MPLLERNECYCLVAKEEICRALKKKMVQALDAPRLMKTDGKIKTPTKYALYECYYIVIRECIRFQLHCNNSVLTDGLHLSHTATDGFNKNVLHSLFKNFKTLTSSRTKI